MYTGALFRTFGLVKMAERWYGRVAVGGASAASGAIPRSRDSRSSSAWITVTAGEAGNDVHPGGIAALEPAGRTELRVKA